MNRIGKIAVCTGVLVVLGSPILFALLRRSQPADAGDPLSLMFSSSGQPHSIVGMDDGPELGFAILGYATYSGSFTTDEADELLSVLLRKQVNADTVVMVNYALRHASDVAEAHLLARVMAFAEEGDWAAASTTASALESISKETYAPLAASLSEKQGAPDGVQEVHALALRIAHARGLDQTQSFLGPRGNKDMLKKRQEIFK